MRLNLVLSIILVISLLSCNPAKMKVSDNLKENSTELEVSDKQGWQLNRVLRFGEFKTSKVKGGWQTGSNFHFIIDFQEIEQKYSFDQKDSLGNKTNVYCVATLKADHFKALDGLVTVPVEAEDVFNAKIVANSGQSIWELTLFNPNRIAFSEDTKGELKFENMHYEIKPVRELEQGSFGPRIIGYDFHLDNQVVAAVQTLDNGMVWLNNNLDADQRLILASACSAIMLREDLELGDDD